MGKGRQPELIKDISVVLGLHSKMLADLRLEIDDIIKVIKQNEDEVIKLSNKLEQLVKNKTKKSWQKESNIQQKKDLK
jgi:ElaB/YqjD/DUF883 family membrane-anchored ribosome-binding protein